METLNKQIALLEEQLQLNQKADDARHILGEYKAIFDPLSKVDSSLKTVLDYYKTLQVLPEDAPKKMAFSGEVKDAAKKTIFILKAFTERWKKEEHEARQGNDLANAKQSLESLSLFCQGEVERCWLGWVNFLESLVRLEEVLLQSQKNIPGMEEIFSGFVKARSRFRELVEELPTDPDVIYELKILREKMIKLKGKMNFDLPQDVSIFFKDLDIYNSKVSLSSLTPGVLKWLSENNMLGEFVVSRKGKY